MSQWIKRIFIKSPRFRVATTLIPLCPVFCGGKDYQKGEPFLPPFGKPVLSLPKEGGGEGFSKVFSNR